ncbi:MAG: ABC transporter [Finegoldia sp.]|nr:ABC transporter [Finegoldia sp.]
MYVLEDIEKSQKLKKIDLKLKLYLDEGQIIMFAGHDKNTDVLFEIMGSFDPKYEGNFYKDDQKSVNLSSKDFVSEISYSRALASYNKDMKVSKYIKLKRQLADNFDSEFLSRVLEKFNIDTKVKFDYLKEDYANIVLMATALAANKKLTLLGNFDFDDRQAELEFIDMILDRFRQGGQTIFIRSEDVNELFFNRMIILKDGKVEFDQSQYEIVNKAKLIKGPAIALDKFKDKRVLAQSDNDLEAELKIYDEITPDEMDYLIGNKAEVKNLGMGELIKFVEEGSYGEVTKTEID